MSLPREQAQLNYVKVADVIQERQPGMKGIVTITDQHDLQNSESPLLLNMYFDQGVIGNRPGASLYAAKPAVETGTPLQLMLAKASDGENYIIAVYTSGTSTNNFYVYDVVNTRWIPINGSHIPTFTVTSYFGSQNWNNKKGDDRIYFCNGYDDVGRWNVALDYLAQAGAVGETTLTLTDTSNFFFYTAVVTAVGSNVLTLTASPEQTFPYNNTWQTGDYVYYVGTGISGLTTNTLYYAIKSAYTVGGTDGSSQNSCGLALTLADAKAGNVISISGTPSNATIYKATPITVYDGSTSTELIYYNVSGSTLVLTAALAGVLASGSSVCPVITDRVGMEKGKILTTWNSRFILAAGYKAENTMYVSRISDPEDFLRVNTDVSSGTVQVFNDGTGGITDVKDFGEFLVVSKSNIEMQFSFKLDATLAAQIPEISPIISGVGMGPQNTRSAIKALNSIWYPSGSAGFIQLSPVATGVTSSTGLQVISYNINNIYPTYDFSQSKSGFWRNKLFWTATSGNSQNFIFVYDTIRTAWSKFDSWNPADFLVTNNNNFYFLSANDGNLYQAFSGYTDNSNPYTAQYYSKMNLLGSAFYPKTIEPIYLEGYMTQSTVLYADVLYNELGKLFTIHYRLTNGVAGFQFTNVTIGGLGQFPQNESINDTLTPDMLQNFGYFRCFLGVPPLGLYAVQLKIFSKDANAVWYLTGHSIKPTTEISIPANMVVSPIDELVVSI